MCEMEEDIHNHNREKYESLSEDSFFNRTEYSLLLEYALTDLLILIRH